MDSISKSEEDTPTAVHIQDPSATSGDLQLDERQDIQSIEGEAIEDAEHINLSWRSWLVVFITCFAIMSQVMVSTSAGSVIAFIVRDLGESALSGWVIQVRRPHTIMMFYPNHAATRLTARRFKAPLLMQSVLSPIVGRLSDVLDRKFLASVPPLIAFVGAVVSAKATSMSMLIGGSVLIGTTLSTIAIVQAIPSEILPLKYRALANGFSFMGGAIGGIIGGLGAGAVTNVGVGGWRYIFWIQAAFHGATSLGLFLFYWPPKRSGYPRMRLKDYVWACDPIGSTLFICGATLVLLALDWVAGSYSWSDAHVVSLLSIGLAFLVAFSGYEWKGRSDGLLAHVFFRHNANFALSTFAFFVEGWIFYSAVNTVVPQIILNLGFETDPWQISIRQLSYAVLTIVVSVPMTWYATAFKDMKTPLLVTFTVFLVVTICYTCIKPTWSKQQIVFNVLTGIGQSGPLTLLVACVQFTAPHAFLSTATGMAFSARAIGGAFGSAVLNAIISGRLAKSYAPAVGKAAVDSGLPSSKVPDLLAALASGVLSGVQGATPEVWSAATEESRWQYAKAYRLAFASIIPFVVLAIVAVSFLKGVKELMTEKVEATVEHTPKDKDQELKQSQVCGQV